MGKHTSSSFVLACTLSTHREGMIERTLTGQGLYLS
jgi:hypothetical protein